MGAKLSSTSSGDSGSDFSEASEIADINVTPFVDVVLVLLVVFMVTAPMILKDAIGLKLPKSESANEKVQTPLGIAITAGGQILVNGQPADDEAVRAAAKAALSKDPSSAALLSADEKTPHGDVVRAIDLVRSVGLTRFSIQVQQTSKTLPKTNPMQDASP